MSSCLQCQKPLKRQTEMYCSNKCQMTRKYVLYIDEWKRGLVDGSRGKNAKNISQHVRRYLLAKYEEACAFCGWQGINPATGKVMLEVDHIDGNSENNAETNLRLLCPNCHSLTPNFRNLNKGRGRKWRKMKYLKSI